MCFSLIWKDLFKSIQTYRLKSQLLICYIPGITLVMCGLVIIIYILLNNLEYSTVHEIEKTLDSISTHNSLDFIKEYSKTVENQLNNTAIISSYMNFYINNLAVQNLDNNTLRLPFITPYEYLPRECTVKITQYDSNYVCMNYSSVTSLSKNQNITKKLGYLAYIFPEIFTLLSPYIHRIIVFVPKENSTVLFPGQQLPIGYSTFDSMWYQSLCENWTYPFVFVPPYTDSLNRVNRVISIAQRMDFESGNEGCEFIGITVEIQESLLYSLFPGNAYLLEDEEKVLVTVSGQVLLNPNSTLFKGITHLKQFDKELWEKTQNQELKKNFFMLYKHKNFYRVTIEKIPSNGKTTWLYMLLFLNENTLMKYKNETQDTLNSFSYLLLGLTCIIGVIIIIVSAIIVNLTGMSVSKPLIGIKTLTDRINIGEVDIEKELERLEEGTEQVADLVRAFKSLAKTVSFKRNTDVQVKGKTEIYPPNELFKAQRLTWKDFLKNIPE